MAQLKCLTALIVVGIVLMTPGCAGVPLAPQKAQDAVRRFEPPANKAYIYVMRPWRLLNASVPVKAKLDEQTFRNLENGTFLFFEVEPKLPHDVTVVMLFWPKENKPSAVRLDCLPGQSYYLLAEIKSKAVIELRNLPEQEGRKYVTELNMLEASDAPSGL